MFNNALEKVSAGITNIIRITQITFAFFQGFIQVVSNLLDFNNKEDFTQLQKVFIV